MAVRPISDERDLETLRACDLRAVLDVVSDVGEAADLDDFALRALRGLIAAVGCDIASYNEMDPVSGRALTVAIPEETLFVGAEEILARHLHEHPIVMHYATTGDSAVRTLSDFVTQRQLHNTGYYAELYRPIDGEYLAAVQLTLPAPLVVGLGLFRASRDFCSRERRMLGVLQPRLAQAYAHVMQKMAFGSLEAAIADGGRDVVVLARDGRPAYLTAGAVDRLQRWFGPYRAALPVQLTDWLAGRCGTDAPLVVDGADARLVARLVRTDTATAVVLSETSRCAEPSSLVALGLSRREADVLALVALGQTNAAVGGVLSISPRTVKKHLESIYDKLGVRTRTGAAAIALTTR